MKENRTAFVTSTDPLEVTFPGMAASVRALKDSDYDPAIGDLVAVLPIDGSRLYVPGKVG